MENFGLLMGGTWLSERLWSHLFSAGLVIQPFTLIEVYYLIAKASGCHGVGVLRHSCVCKILLTTKPVLLNAGPLRFFKRLLLCCNLSVCLDVMSVLVGTGWRWGRRGEAGARVEPSSRHPPSHLHSLQWHQYVCSPQCKSTHQQTLNTRFRLFSILRFTLRCHTTHGSLVGEKLLGESLSSFHTFFFCTLLCVGYYTAV